MLLIWQGFTLWKRDFQTLELVAFRLQLLVCVCVLCHHCCMGCFTMLNVYYMFGAPAPGHWIFPSVGISVPM